MRSAAAPSAWTWMLVLAALLFAPAVARGDDVSAQSEEDIHRGIELRRLGKNRDALEAFQHAYALHPTPRALAQMALARQALADWVEAERGTEDALRATDDPWISRYRDVLEKALATIRNHLATLYVEANVTQGELVLNGAPGGALPAPGQPLRVVAGTLQFEVRSPGYATVRRTLEVSSGAQVHVVITLEPAAASDGADATGAVQTASGSVARNGAIREAQGGPSTTARRDEARRTTWAYVAFAAAGVLAGGGVAAAVVQENNAAIWNDNSRCLKWPNTRAQQCGSYGDAANIAMGFEIGTFAAAAGSAAIGAWLLWAPRTWWSPISSRCAPWATIGVQCGARF